MLASRVAIAAALLVATVALSCSALPTTQVDPMSSGNTTMAPATQNTTMAPTTMAPTTQNTTMAPTTHNTTMAPTTHNTTMAPTTHNTTMSPTTHNTTMSPTTHNTTMSPTTHNTTMAPTTHNTTMSPTTHNTTMSPTTTTTVPASEYNMLFPEVNTTTRLIFASLSFVTPNETVSVCKSSADCMNATLVGDFIVDAEASTADLLALSFRGVGADLDSVTLSVKINFDKDSFAPGGVEILYVDASTDSSEVSIGEPFNLDGFSSGRAYQCSEVSTINNTVSFTQLKIQSHIPLDNQGRFSNVKKCPHDVPTTTTNPFVTTTTTTVTEHPATTVGPAPTGSKPLSSGAVAAISIVALILVGGGIAYFLRLRRKNARSAKYGILSDDANAGYSAIAE